MSSTPRGPGRLAATMLVASLALAGCGGDSGADGPVGPTKPVAPVAAAIVVSSVVPASAQVGQDVPVSVRVTDAGGAPVVNAPVSFTVTGGGTLSAGSATTNASGIAAVTWTLGTRTGSNALVASSGAAPAATITVAGRPGAPAAATSILGHGLTAPVGTSTGVSPQFYVVDRYGNAVPDVPVEFRLVSGGGTLLAPKTKTDASGSVFVGWWRLGPNPGVNVVEATVAGAAQPIRFTAMGRAVTTPFAVDVRYEDSTRLSASQRDAVRAAAARVRSLITATFAPVPYQASAGICGGVPLPAMNEVITNPIVFVYVRSFGADSAWRDIASTNAVGGPCAWRTSPGARITGVGRVVVNADRLGALEEIGGIEKTITHELLHALGFGSFWRASSSTGWTDLVSGRGTSDPRFIGPLAVTAFGALPGSRLGAVPVPVDNVGAAGTIESHWRASTFDSELMTGGPRYVGYRPLSTVTIASLGDIGYSVDQSQADAFALPASSTPSPALRALARLECGGAGPLTGFGHVIDERTGRIERRLLRSLVHAGH